MSAKSLSIHHTAVADVKGQLPSHMTAMQCKKARQARDARFDGQFVVAVKTTGIFCRPICPVVMPKEENVEYFGHSMQAANAGYRPCLRCRPDSAPESWAWRGTETTFIRALKLIESGALQECTLSDLSDRLGITDRYLRKLFKHYLGTSPKQFDTFKRLMFAKQLLHDSDLSIEQVAYAAGFNSVRRFNDAFKKQLELTPSKIRKTIRASKSQTINLSLAFRPPFDWQQFLAFYRARQIQGLEQVTEDSYGRSFHLNQSQGWFVAKMNDQNNALDITVGMEDVSQLQSLVTQLRRFFDLDADLWVVESQLKKHIPDLRSGVRLPGILSVFEAGVRAILGQQVSVTAARNLVQQCVDELGERLPPNDDGVDSIRICFPAPEAFAQSDLMFLRMPDSRRQTLKRLADWCINHPDGKVEDWIGIKGIGPWTVDYARMRGLSEPDVFLSSDLGVKHGLNKLSEQGVKLESDKVTPWGSYATLQLWLKNH